MRRVSSRTPVGIAVLREGFEAVLFLYGVIVSSEAGSGLSILGGGMVGMLLGGGVCALTYWGLLSIPTRRLFSVTSALIEFLAAGMAAQATAFLGQANAVTALPQVVWDSSLILPDTSILGRALRTLIGYSDRPTAMELCVYLAVLAVILLLICVRLRCRSRVPSARRPDKPASLVCLQTFRPKDS
jgi:high-affinity iron transporter